MLGMMNTAECANRIGLHPETLKAYRCRGLGPTPTKICRKVWYAERDVSAWLEKNTERLEPSQVDPKQL